MTNKTLTMAIGAALLIPTVAFAQVQVSNGEAGMIFKDAPSTVTRAQVLAQTKSGKVVQNGWTYVGGEAGWTLQQAEFVFDNGQLVHAADCPFLASLNVPVSKDPASAPLFTGA
jgi:alpha-D-ribose 1-methylphosphonate 5-triphosphate synthase subunit PhnG